MRGYLVVFVKRLVGNVFVELVFLGFVVIVVSVVSGDFLVVGYVFVMGM